MNGDQLVQFRDQEIRELRHTVTQLSKRLQESSSHAQRIERAYKDALLLANWTHVHIAPTLRYAAYHKVSRRRWQNAVGLLRLAGVIRYPPGYAWLYRDLLEVTRRIDAIKSFAISNPGAYKASLSSHANHEWEKRYR